MDWCWYLVTDEKGNVDEAFNSLEGAKLWKEEHGGIIIKVKAVDIITIEGSNHEH